MVPSKRRPVVSRRAGVGRMARRGGESSSPGNEPPPPRHPDAAEARVRFRPVAAPRRLGGGGRAAEPLGSRRVVRRGVGCGALAAATGVEEGGGSARPGHGEPYCSGDASLKMPQISQAARRGRGRIERRRYNLSRPRGGLSREGDARRPLPLVVWSRSLVETPLQTNEQGESVTSRPRGGWQRFRHGCSR
jgi:hypothetical protein